MSYLPYISDHNLENAVQRVVDCMRAAQLRPDTTLYKNVIDPFSAIFDSVVDEITFNDWLKREKVRQIQKTVQNAIGEFHQEIIGSIPGWQNLGTGQIVDVFNSDLKIIAEIKNKHNTVKGSDRVVIYDDLLHALGTASYQDFTAYYVEIVPKKDRKKLIYHRPFTPSDKKTKTSRPPHPNIIIIKGQDFYDIATGIPSSLSMLFTVLPDVISKVAKLNQLSQQEKVKFINLFDRAY